MNASSGSQHLTRARGHALTDYNKLRDLQYGHHVLRSSDDRTFRTKTQWGMGAVVDCDNAPVLMTALQGLGEGRGGR